HLATDAIHQYLEEQWDAPISTEEMLRKALMLANRAIINDQKQHPERADMGTTAVVLTFRKRDRQPWCAHVGDSRLYRFRGSKIAQITEDHTWIARAVREGELTADQSRIHPWRHVLSQCLGREDMNRIDVQRVEAQVGDRFLLCSDGLTEELSDSIIASHLKTIRASESVVKALIHSAKQHGGRDNITVIIVTLLPDNAPQEGEVPTGFVVP
ncbi:MAG: serine/threonine-protein phosphatase, partial [Leptolyngbya sp. SIO1D8]|nr:serine/threonine-protein phosphatase [Leptolyngbya sp. SIO1D8]